MLRNQPKSARKDEVAAQNGNLVAPFRIRRRLSPPRICLINHIVVHERCRMDELQSRRQRQHAPQVEVFPSVGRQQGKRRADALPARSHQMRPNLRHQLLRRRHRRQQRLLQLLQIAFYHIKHRV